MKQFWFQLIGLILVIAGALWFSFTPGMINNIVGKGMPSLSVGGSKPNPGNIIRIVSADGTQVKAELNIEIANTPDKQRLGLGNRPSLDKNAGMLFLMSDLRQPTFWMKGMEFPLDIIWIKDDEIVGMEVQVPNQPANTPDDQLPKYSPAVPINKVLEVNSGFAKDHDLSVGDKIRQVQ